MSILYQDIFTHLLAKYQSAGKDFMAVPLNELKVVISAEAKRLINLQSIMKIKFLYKLLTLCIKKITEI